MAAITICSDFGAQKNKFSPCFPIYLPWSDGTGCHDLSFLNVKETQIKTTMRYHLMSVRISSVHSLSHVQLFATAWIAACQASLSITNSQSSLRLTSIKSVMPSSHLILGRPLLLLPPISPASESFPMRQIIAWGGQSTGVSVLASFLPKKSQGWSSEWTGWVSLQSKGLSRVFSNTTVQKHQFFGAQLFSQSNSHPHLTTGKTSALTRLTFVGNVCFSTCYLGWS